MSIVPSRLLPGGVQVRAASAEEMEQYLFVARLALSAHGEAARNPDNWTKLEWTSCVFEDGALVSSFGVWPFTMRFNGQPASIAGVTGIGALPTKRRRGYLRAAMETSLQEQQERGQSIAALFASQAGIYQRFGYAVCSRRLRYELDPRDLTFVHVPTPAGNLRVVNVADLPDHARILRDVYKEFARPPNVALERDD